MTSFKIHEDVENRLQNVGGNKKAIEGKRISNIETKGDKKGLEKRRVLGHLTSNVLQPYCDKWNSKTTNQSIYVDHADVENCRNVNAINSKRCSDKELLDNACSLIPTYAEEILTCIDTPKCEHDAIEVMSIDGSNIKSNVGLVVEQYDNRLSTYTKKLYREDIYMYLLEAETRHRPHCMYMTKQTELSDSMRCILVDWLVSISDEYTFSPETLHLAVSYVDRFLSKMSVVRAKLQLVGVAAIMIAAKYEEIYPPDTGEFAFLTNDTYTVKQILRMEQLMLRALSFDLTTPTTQTFIDEYAAQSDISKESVNMAMFLSELCLVESVHYTRYLPSELAASSLALSRHTLQEDMWPRELENVSGYTLTKLFPIVKQQHQVFKESPSRNLQAVRFKYSKESYSSVSNMTPQKLNYE